MDLRELVVICHRLGTEGLSVRYFAVASRRQDRRSATDEIRRDAAANLPAGSDDRWAVPIGTGEREAGVVPRGQAAVEVVRLVARFGQPFGRASRLRPVGTYRNDRIRSTDRMWVDLAAWYSVGTLYMACCPIVFTPNIDHVRPAVENPFCSLRIYRLVDGCHTPILGPNVGFVHKYLPA